MNKKFFVILLVLCLVASMTSYVLAYDKGRGKGGKKCYQNNQPFFKFCHYAYPL